MTLDINDDKPGFEVTASENFNFVTTNTGKPEAAIRIGGQLRSRDERPNGHRPLVLGHFWTAPAEGFHDRAWQFCITRLTGSDQKPQGRSHGRHIFQALLDFDNLALRKAMRAMTVALCVEKEQRLDLGKRETESLRA